MKMGKHLDRNFEGNSSIFKPGEEVLLYVKPVGLTYKKPTEENGNKLYSLNMTADLIVLDKNGSIGEQNIPLTNFTSRNQNKEIVIDLLFIGTGCGRLHVKMDSYRSKLW
jgi:hypothetical protein